MGKKVIRISLSEKDIGRAIKELERYKQDIIRKSELLQQKVAEKIESLVKSGFDGAIVDDLTAQEKQMCRFLLMNETMYRSLLPLVKTQYGLSSAQVCITMVRLVVHLTRTVLNSVLLSAVMVKGWARDLLGVSMKTENFVSHMVLRQPCLCTTP